MNQKLLQQRSLTPVRSTFITRPSLRRRCVSVPMKLEVTWKTLSNASCSCQQGSPGSTKELKLPEVTTSQKGTNSQGPGHMNLDAFGTTKLTGRKLSHPDNLYIKRKPTVTPKKQKAVHEDYNNHLQSECVQERSEAPGGGALSRCSGREVRPGCLNPDPV